MLRFAGSQLEHPFVITSTLLCAQGTFWTSILSVGVMKVLVHSMSSHTQVIVATMVNRPNEQKGTHQDGTWLLVQQACRLLVVSTFAFQSAPVSGFSAANDGAF